MAAAGLVISQLWMPSNQRQEQTEHEHESIPSAGEAVMDVSNVATSADEAASSSINVTSGDNTNNTNAEASAPAPAAAAAAAPAAAPTSTSGESDRLRRHEAVQNLRNLEEERESRRRRTSTCILIATFFLFRLWVEALASSDSSLLLVALLLTSWVLKWVQTNRETEDEIDRAIQEYIQRADEEEGGGILSRSAMARASAIENGDLRLMSFQAQLALAILESQRQMMENGGYGAEDNGGGEAADGLDDEAKARWQRFSYHTTRKTNSISQPSLGGGEHGASWKRKKRFGLPLKRGGYGSVPVAEGPDGPNAAKDNHDSDPACSICLCEYDDGEDMAKVSCGHTYHFHCIDAWAEAHHRCPLCNYDMRGAETNV